MKSSLIERPLDGSRAARQNAWGMRAFYLLPAILCGLAACTTAKPGGEIASCPAPRAGAMTWVPAGSFRMGSDDGYPEEGPARQVSLPGFWIDTYELTNAEFAAFVAATGYRTLAEREPPILADATPDMLEPGSAVFTVPDSQDRRWWRWRVGANWRQPEGPGSSIAGKENSPVVQIAWDDALAYARWADKVLPTEEQWEYAGRGGLAGKTYSWGDERDPDGAYKANYYQGVFPQKDLGLDGHEGRAPAGCFPPNGYGLYDMIGNVWEWTVRADGAQANMRVIKGGSFLCADNYCARYRPAARQFQERDLGTNHIGVRFVRNADGP